MRNRGDPDYGIFDFWLLDQIQEVCEGAGFASPLPDYVSLYKEAKEKGRCIGGFGVAWGKPLL